MKRNHTLAALILILIFCGKANASNYYWVGGSGIWSDFDNHWATTSGGSNFYTQAPTSADNVFFDGNSFTALNQAVILDNNVVLSCNNMDWTGATNNPILNGAATELDIYGSLTFITDMSIGTTASFVFKATTAGQTITTAGQPNIGGNPTSFNGVGGSWTLQDDFTITHPLYILDGTLNTNGKTVNIASFSVAQGGTSHTLNLGSSVVNVTGNWGGNDAGFVLNAGTSTINMTGDGSSFNANAGVVTTYYDVNFTGDGGATFNGGNNTFHNVAFSSGANIQGNNTFNNLTLNPNGLTTTYTLQGGRTTKVNGSLKVNGICTSFIALLSSNTTATTINIPTGSPTITYATLTYVSATGANAPFTAANSTDGGNNSGFTITSAAANLYWIGGSGNWSDGSHWSLTSGGAPYDCIPVSVSNVHFDANSFPAGNEVTVDVTANCNNMDWTGATNTPTFAVGSNTLNIYGSLTLVAGMTMTGSGLMQFLATTAGHTIKTNGVSITCGVWFGTPGQASTPINGGIGGVWDLQDNLTIAPGSNTNAIFLNNGTLNTNSHTINAYTMHLDYGTQNTAITVNPGSSIFNLVVFNGNGAQMTMDATAATFNVSGNRFNNNSENPALVKYGNINFTEASGNVDFTTCGTIYGNISNVGSSFNLAGNAANTFGNFDMHVGGCTIQQSNTFNNLTLSSNGGTYTFEKQFGSGLLTETILGTILGGSGTCSNLLVITSSDPGAIFSQAHGSVTFNYAKLTWITATGGAVFTDNNGIDNGNNSGWIMNTTGAPDDLYWIGGTGNWSDGNHWSATSGGTPFGGCFPFPNSNVHFDANSFSGAGQTATIDITASCKNMDWTGALYNPALAGSGNLSIYGSLTLIAGMTCSNNGPVNFLATTAGQTITLAGHANFGGNPTSFGTSSDPVGAPDWTFQDDFSMNHMIILQYGTIYTNNKTVNATTIAFNYYTNPKKIVLGSSVVNLSGSWQGNGATGFQVDGGTSTINITGPGGFASRFSNNSATGTGYDVNFTGTGTASFDGGGLSYHNVNCPYGADPFAGNNTFNDVVLGGSSAISGNNSYNNLTLNPTTTAKYTLTVGKTQTIAGALNATGSANNLIQIISDTTGSPTTISKATGTVCTDYLLLADSHATGGAVFNAGANSQDAGGNSGWFFGSPNPTSVVVSSSSSGAICSAGQTITFTANAASASALTYQWKVNGNAVGGNNKVFSSNTLNIGDVVVCTIIANSPCGTGADTLTSPVVTITTGTTGIPGVVTTTSNTTCSGSTVNLTSAGSSGSLQWEEATTQGQFSAIPGATNATYAATPLQTTYYRLKAGTSTCADSSNVILITTKPTPVASFTFSISGEQVTFNAGGSNGATTYDWDFGDSGSSNEANPTHTFAKDTTYRVCLDVSNGSNCSSTLCHDVNLVTGIPSVANRDNWNIYPSPFNDRLIINSLDKNRQVKSVELVDLTGRTILVKNSTNTQGNLIELNTAYLIPGMYFIKVETNTTSYIQQVIKQ